MHLRWCVGRSAELWNKSFRLQIKLLSGEKDELMNGSFLRVTAAIAGCTFSLIIISVFSPDSSHFSLTITLITASFGSRGKKE